MGRVAAWVLTFAMMMGGVGRTAESQAAAQEGARPAAWIPETSVGAVLRNLASRAGVVFVGQVVRIEPRAGTVEITFQVQQPVLGTVGATYKLREWSGLWAGGQQRYRLGERAMIFLHSPSRGSGNAGGLSSPVDGMAGVVPVVVQGADTGALLDVRWLDTRVLRAVGAPLADAEDGAITLADATAVVAGWKNANGPEPLPRPLPVGVRPAQPVQPQSGPTQPVQSQPGATLPGPGVGIFGGPKPRPLLPVGTPLPPSGSLQATPGTPQTNGVHNMVRPATAGEPDGIR